MAAAALADTLQPVELADGVEIQLRVAGPAARSAAWFIDLLIFCGCLFGASIIAGLTGIAVGENASQGLMLLIVFVFMWFYNVIFEIGPRGASPGQRSMGLKVVSVSGAPVRLPQSMIRNLLRGVDFMPFGYLVGLLCCLFTKKFQRLGDIVADTVVIYAEEKPAIKPAQQVNAEPLAPPAALSREEQAALAQFQDRAPLWSDARKVELSDVLEPLTNATGLRGLTRLAGMILWLQNTKAEMKKQKAET